VVGSNFFFGFAMNLSGQSFTSHNELMENLPEKIVKDTLSFLFF